MLRPIVVLLADKHACDHNLSRDKFGKDQVEKSNWFLPRILGIPPLHRDPILSGKGVKQSNPVSRFFLLFFSFLSSLSLSLPLPSFPFIVPPIQYEGLGPPLEEASHTSLSSVCWVDPLGIFS